MDPPRVAFFPDSFDEPNGVAVLGREFVNFAERQQLPLLYARAGPKKRVVVGGSVLVLELNRSRFSFAADKGLYCDVLLMRHRKWALEELKRFQPDLVHITGPGDFGILGCWLAHSLRIPLVTGWHTNLHEYAARRVQASLSYLPIILRHFIGRAARGLSLIALMRFYRLATIVLAPNQVTVHELEERAHKPVYLMPHGVDSTRFSPNWRTRTNGPFTIGYVGRLTPEKNVRTFRELERVLLAAGERYFRLLLVGDGSEREWLRENVQFAELPGFLLGQTLAAAYADMDVFVFPSRTDTFGLVILEAMASGVPVVVTPETGDQVHILNGDAGLLTEDFAGAVLKLMRDEGLRRQMGIQARRLACLRDWAAVFQDLYQTYGETLKTHQDLQPT